jgi:hypothetical protein
MLFTSSIDRFCHLDIRRLLMIIHRRGVHPPEPMLQLHYHYHQQQVLAAAARLQALLPPCCAVIPKMQHERRHFQLFLQFPTLLHSLQLMLGE